MARPLRIECAGAVYHMTSRGNTYQTIFPTLEDCEAFLRVLGRTVQRMGWRCHANCLMGTRYHLVAETPDAEGSPSRGTRHLNGVCTQGFTRGHTQVGHVLRGPHKAEVVDRDANLLELCRSVVQNPVRVGMVKEAGGYRGRWRVPTLREETI